MNLRMFQRSVSVLLLSLAVLAAAPDSLAQLDAATRDKIRGDIYHHQKLKQLPAGRALADHRRAMFAAGINGGDLEREEIVIYVADRLTKAEIEALRVQGVDRSIGISKSRAISEMSDGFIRPKPAIPAKRNFPRRSLSPPTSRW